MHGHKRHDDPECTNIFSGFIFAFSDCPVLWISKFQTETTFTTMELEIISLARYFRELFPIININRSLGKSVGLTVGVPYIKLSIHKDNVGAIILSRTLPSKFTPCSKYYATKTIWFCEEINKRKILLLEISTTEQMRDLFTKGLPRANVE